MSAAVVWCQACQWTFSSAVPAAFWHALHLTLQLNLVVHAVAQPCECCCCCGAGMSVDLQQQPSFSLDLPKENWSPDEYEDCPLVRLGRRGSAGSSRSSRRNK